MSLNQSFRKGFTLNEVVVSLGILFISSVGVTALISTGMSMPRKVDQSIALNQRAQTVMDQLLVAVDNQLHASPLDLNSLSMPPTGTSGDCSYQLAMVPTDPPIPHFTQLVLTVKDKRGQTSELRALRRTEPLPPLPPPPPPPPAPPTATYFLPSDPPVRTGSQLISSSNCNSCHGATDLTSAPAWNSGRIAQNAAANGMTTEEYIAARISGSTPLVSGPAPRGGTYQSNNRIMDAQVDPAQAAAMTAAIMQQLNIPRPAP